MISVFEMLPISRRRVGLSTTGKRSDRVSELETVVIAGDIMDENFPSISPLHSTSQARA
jgi:hypothetical protein